ncbi:MAG: DUF115 domain-containing protein [Treponema sp.]|jgi:hypothetical protein|nr:DUF115 domain-containing protein [Treponema sp.]
MKTPKAENRADAAFWESNSAILRKQYPGLLEEITRPGGDLLANEDMQIETSASGAPVLAIRGLYVHSPRDPAREGRRLLESINDGGPKGPIIILGFGFGYAAQAAAELAPERPVIIVEKYRNLLQKALELQDMGKLLLKPNIAFVPGGSTDGIQAALSLFENASAEKSAPFVIRNRTLVDLDAEWYAAVESRIRAWTMRDDINMATLKRFGKRWVRNLSRNASAIRDLPGISRLAFIASNGNNSDAAESETLPVFLAAAGPGLDSAGPLLPEIRRRCIMVAVDTSLRFLLGNGVDPDFALVVDPQFWNSRHLDRAASAHTQLIAESAVYPPALRLPFKGVYLCGSLFPLGSFIEQRVDPKGLLGAGGSVATTAWDFARILGAREIWIAGLDLAFPGLKTHFKGALFEEKSHAESGRLRPAETWLVHALRDGLPFPAPANSGGQVLTDRRLSLYAAWFENRFRQFPAVHNYSLSAGGLAIAGLEPAETKALLALPDRRAEIDRRLTAASTRIEADFFAPEETRRRAWRYAGALESLLRGLCTIKAAAEKGAAIAEQALRRDPPPAEQNRILAALDEITRAITESEVKEVAGFLFPAGEVTDTAGGDPFRAYLKNAARLYRSLAETAGFNVQAMQGKNPV